MRAGEGGAFWPNEPKQCAMFVLILRSAHAEDVPQNSNVLARVSKDEDGRDCALMLRDAAPECGEDLLARADGAAPQDEGSRGRCILAKRSRHQPAAAGSDRRLRFHCFGLLITMD